MPRPTLQENVYLEAVASMLGLQHPDIYTQQTCHLFMLLVRRMIPNSKSIKEKKPEMQIILLTGHATVQKGVEAMKAGALDVVEKPADLDDLSEKIKAAHDQKAVVLEKQHHDKVIEALQKFGM